MVDKQQFIEAVIKKGIASDDELSLLMDQHNDDTFEVVQALLRKEIAPKEILGKLWGDFIQTAYVDLEKTIFQHEYVLRLPEKFARKHKIIPLYRLGERVTVAVTDPCLQEMLAQAETIMGLKLSCVFSFPDEIHDAIDIQYQSTYSFEEYAARLPEIPHFYEMDYLNEEMVNKLVNEKPVMNFTHALLMLGVKDRASEIHIEHLERLARIRFRIDGVLREKYTMDKIFAYPLSSRLKSLAGLDVTEWLKPQHGGISIRLMSKSLNFRFNSLPLIYGEKATVQVLKTKQETVPDPLDIGISRSNWNLIQAALKKPGLMIVAGTVRSGKTTTLYSLLKHLNKSELNLMAIEDFPEFRLPGVNQAQTDPNSGFTYASALKNFRLMNPDVILVGDLNNAETAELAANNAMEGRLVLSAMPSLSASWVLSLIVELGISRFTAATAINGILAQQLVKRLCDYCKKPYRLPNNLYQRYFKGENHKKAIFYKAVGCSECGNTGYSGQIPIHEFLPMSQEIRTLMIGNTAPFVLEKVAEKYGFQPMRYDALKKALLGYITLEEPERSLVI